MTILFVAMLSMCRMYLLAVPSASHPPARRHSNQLYTRDHCQEKERTTPCILHIAYATDMKYHKTRFDSDSNPSKLYRNQNYDDLTITIIYEKTTPTIGVISTVKSNDIDDFHLFFCYGSTVAIESGSTVANDEDSIPSKGNGEVERHESGRSLSADKHVRYDGWCDGRVARLTHTHQSAVKHKQGE